jgi:hypothetical protein
MRVPITTVTIRATPDEVALMPLVEADLRSALRVQAFDTAVGESRLIRVEGYQLG